MVDGHPVVGSPKNAARTKKKIKANIATTKDIKPIKAENTKGNSEKATIPSQEYLNNCQNDKEVLPCSRSIFSYSR